MRARAAKCIAAGSGHFEKYTSDYLFLVTKVRCRFALYPTVHMLFTHRPGNEVVKKQHNLDL